MNEIQDALLALLPPKRKTTPSGWTSFDAVCCHHMGNSRDTRKRGGILTNPDGGFQYHCFNCNFKAGWSPGKMLSKNTKSLFKWVGMTDADIGKMNLVALKVKDDQPVVKKALNFTLVEKELPEGSETMFEWAMDPLRVDEETMKKLIDTIQYVINRGFDPHDKRFFWSPAPGYADRVLIPFYQDGKIVGHTGRKITEGKPKYLTDAQPGYVFNIDQQTADKQFVIVVEGQFDAIAIEGVAVMHNQPNEVQIMRINALGREVIVVPDRDKPGAKMIETAIAQGWSVSMPPWEDDIKDAADAVHRYGRLYTLATILHYKVSGEINLHLLKKKLENGKD